MKFIDFVNYNNFVAYVGSAVGYVLKDQTYYYKHFILEINQETFLDSDDNRFAIISENKNIGLVFRRRWYMSDGKYNRLFWVIEDDRK